METHYSLAARHIGTWDRLDIEAGPDRLVLSGKVDVTSKTSNSISIGLKYEQIDQLVLDLLAARRNQPQVEECRWCPSTGPVVKYHPRGQVAHVGAVK